MANKGSISAVGSLLRLATLLMSVLLSNAFSFPPCVFSLTRTAPHHSHRLDVIAGALHEDAIDSSDSIVPRGRVDLRRALIASTFAIAPFLGWGNDISIIEHPAAFLQPPAAHALKEKNEVLCNTGFFTNVGAWYCTDIGNIGDEGKPKPMSGDAEASVDSLMSKFDLSGGGVEDFGGGGSNANRAEKELLDEKKDSGGGTQQK